ncbi:MAG: CoA transferase [Oscillospiraceae bacterium]|nr:CoA transferase [Oscillospiraceae bacterium]
MYPLEGIKVVELGTHVAAPTVGRMCAEWGADVIKVEPPKGEAYRTVGITWKLPNKEDNNPILQTHNMNKRSIALDLKTPDGKQALLKLLENADVFITNTRSTALERLGLGYEQIRERCPRLIYATCTAFGLTGPDRDGPGFDTASFWGRGGMLAEWSPAEIIPIRPHPGFGDSTVASAILAGIMAALFKREKTGEGEFLTSSLYGTALWYNFHGLVEAQYPGHEVPISRYQCTQPSATVFKAKNNVAFFFIEQQYDAKMPQIFRMLGLEHHAEDPKFVLVAESRKCMKEVVQVLEREFAEIPYETFDKVFTEMNVVHAKICTPSEALNDPQAWQNNYLEKITLENGSELTVPTSPVQFGSFGAPEHKLAPHLGADTAEILRSIGYSEEAIERMLEAGAAVQHK